MPSTTASSGREPANSGQPSTVAEPEIQEETRMPRFYSDAPSPSGRALSVEAGPNIDRPAPPSAPGGTQPSHECSECYPHARTPLTVDQPFEEEWDYSKKYPVAPEPYHELDDNARAWRMYNDEADIYNKQIVGDMKSSLNMLLIFAALFASVLTTFVAQTSQALQQNDSGITNALLIEIVQLQRAQMTGSSPTDIATANTAFNATTTDKWVNGLWFASLVLSLITALLAVLAQQWLRQFKTPRRGNPRQRAHVHHVRLRNFEKWRVLPFIILLPTLLHLAVFLFLIGLVVFLHPLNRAMEYTALGFTTVAASFYIMALFLPVIIPQLPYRLPLLDILILPTCQWICVSILTIIMVAFSPFNKWWWKGPLRGSRADRILETLNGVYHYLRERIQNWMPKRVPIGHAYEQDIIQGSKDPDQSIGIATAAFSWLSEVTSNQSVANILAEIATCCYLSGQDTEQLRYNIPRDLTALADNANHVYRDIRRVMQSCLNGDRILWSADELTFSRDSNGMSLAVTCAGAGGSTAVADIWEMTEPFGFDVFTKMITSPIPPPDIPLATWRALWKIAVELPLLQLSDIRTEPLKDVALHVCMAFDNNRGERNAISAWKELIREAKNEKYQDPPHPFHPITLAHFLRTLVDDDLIPTFLLRNDLPEDMIGFGKVWGEWQESPSPRMPGRTWLARQLSGTWNTLRRVAGASRVDENGGDESLGATAQPDTAAVVAPVEMEDLDVGGRQSVVAGRADVESAETGVSATYQENNLEDVDASSVGDADNGGSDTDGSSITVSESASRLSNRSMV